MPCGYADIGSLPRREGSCPRSGTSLPLRRRRSPRSGSPAAAAPVPFMGAPARPWREAQFEEVWQFGRFMAAEVRGHYGAARCARKITLSSSGRPDGSSPPFRRGMSHPYGGYGAARCAPENHIVALRATGWLVPAFRAGHEPSLRGLLTSHVLLLTSYFGRKNFPPSALTRRGERGMIQMYEYAHICILRPAKEVPR